MKHLPAYALLLALPLLGGCQKEADIVTCEEDAPASIDALLQQHEAPVQKFTVGPGATAAITTAAGYRITIPTGLVRMDGQPLSASPVQVQVREVTKRSDMLFSHTPTLAAGQLLESGGMFNVALSQDNQPLQLASNTRLQVTTTAPSTLSTSNGMRLFTAQPDSLNARQVGSWTPVVAQDTATRVFPLTTPPGFQVFLGATVYNNNTRGLNWVNCGRFVQASPVTSVRISVDAQGATSADTEVFLIFNTLNSVLSASPNGSANRTFRVNTVPVGYAVTAVVLHQAAGQLYFGKQAASVAANHLFSPTLRAVTAAELAAEVQAL